MGRNPAPFKYRCNTRQSLELARGAANKAIEADPQHAAAHTRRAYVLKEHYKLRRREGASDEELRPELDAWLTAAVRAVELDPSNPYAYDVLGIGYTLGGRQDMRVGRDPMPAWGRATVWLGKALELEPDYPWGLNDLALVYQARGNYLVEQARDPRDEYAEAEYFLREALRADPAYLFAYVNLADVHTSAASYELSRGLSPEDEVEKALEVAGKALALDPRYYGSLNQAAFAELVRAEYLVARSEDPRPALDRASGFVERSLAVNVTSSMAWFYLSQGHSLAAHYALQAGEDPRASLEASRRALDEAYRRGVVNAAFRLQSARRSLLEATLASRQGRTPMLALGHALTETKAAVASDPYAEAHQELARVYLRLAEAQPVGATPDPIAEGLAQADLALRLAPNLLQARALRGGLWLARARSMRDAAPRLDAARLALAELERALERNPLLRRDYEGLLHEAKTLVARTQQDTAEH